MRPHTNESPAESARASGFWGAMKTTPDTRPLVGRITQGPYKVSHSKLYFTTEEGAWIAGLRDGFLPIEEKDANTELITETFNVTRETGRTPRQLADERAELIAALRRISEQMRCPDEMADCARNTLTRIQS